MSGERSHCRVSKAQSVFMYVSPALMISVSIHAYAMILVRTNAFFITSNTAASSAMSDVDAAYL